MWTLCTCSSWAMVLTVVLIAGVAQAQEKTSKNFITDDETNTELQGTKEHTDLTFELSPTVDAFVFTSEKRAKKAEDERREKMVEDDEERAATKREKTTLVVYGYVPVRKVSKLEGGLTYSIVLAKTKEAAQKKAQGIEGFGRGSFVTVILTYGELKRLRMNKKSFEGGYHALLYSVGGVEEGGRIDATLRGLVKGPRRAIKGEDLGF